MSEELPSEHQLDKSNSSHVPVGNSSIVKRGVDLARHLPGAVAHSLTSVRVHFAATAIEDLRRLAQQAYHVAAQCRQDGWGRAPFSPANAFELGAYPGLWIKPECSFRTYLDGARWIAFAAPRDSAFPEPQDCMTGVDEEGFPVPVPPGAMADVMDAIEGDGTPTSYMSASLLARDVNRANWGINDQSDCAADRTRPLS